MKVSFSLFFLFSPSYLFLSSLIPFSLVVQCEGCLPAVLVCLPVVLVCLPVVLVSLPIRFWLLETCMRESLVFFSALFLFSSLLVMLVLVRIRSNLRHPSCWGLFLGVGGLLGTLGSRGRPFWVGSCCLCCAGRAFKG